MAKLTIGQKAQRALKFLLGLRNPRVVAALGAHGFTEEHLREGLDHLAAVTRKRLSTRAPVEDPRLIAELDEFENRWFQIARHTLTRRYPQVAEELFLNLVQTTGAGVAVTVTVFLERLAAMEAGTAPFGEQGPAARALLLQRGLTPERVEHASALVDKIGTFGEVAQSQTSPEEQQAAEQALWSWYLEWSGIARVAIRDRRLLRALGFRKSQRGGEEEVVDADEPATSDATTVTVTQVAPAAPAAPAAPVAPQLPSGSAAEQQPSTPRDGATAA